VNAHHDPAHTVTGMPRSHKAILALTLPVLLGLSIALHLHQALPGERAVADALASTIPHGLGRVALAATKPVNFFAVAALLALLAATHRMRDGVLLLVALVGTAVANDTVLKHLVGRVKDHGLAFPSGHATAGALVGVGLTLVLAWRWPQRRVWVLGAVLAALYELVVDWWLLSTRSHYPADVIGSLCVALLIGVLTHAAHVRLGEHCSATTKAPPPGEG
jgi:membrane-associated phospholipid phosphatase